LQVLEPEQSERLTGGPLVPGDAHVFLCGNPEMVQSARALLEPRGFVMSQRRHPGTMHTERYW
jgi:ferredoxin/flavodoxin---NADP+ reductase